jgi:hypothetical protein
MKILSKFRPAFNPTARTLDFSGLPNFNVKRLYGVINLSSNTPIYVAGASGLGITNVDGTGYVVTLNYDTSSQNSTDYLNIYYETDNIPTELNYAMESGGNLSQLIDLNQLILSELRVISHLLKEGLNIKDDLDMIRKDTTIDNVD